MRGYLIEIWGRGFGGWLCRLYFGLGGWLGRFCRGEGRRGMGALALLYDCGVEEEVGRGCVVLGNERLCR